MSYQAKVYKVFIASPSDVKEERNVVKSVLSRWNAVHSESQKIVLLPVGWETHAAPETGKTAQEYINEQVLDDCDILIGIFWSKMGSPTKNYKSGTIEEISRHVSAKKLAMLYFSNKDFPSNIDINEVNDVRKLKERYKNSSLYAEYNDEKDLESKLYDHLQIKITQRKFRPTFDSDILASIKNDDELVDEIKKYFPLVSKNLLLNIMDEDRKDTVWETIIAKLSKSPADLRDALIEMAKRGAIKHKAYILGYNALAKENQADFGNFMNALYSINKYEFIYILKQNLLEDTPFARRLLELIEQKDNCNLDYQFK